EINAGQLHDRRYPGGKPGEIVGQSGVEATYDRWLNGGLQRNRVAVDSLGRAVGPLRPLNVVTPRRGLQLTIDARLQRVAEEAIPTGLITPYTGLPCTPSYLVGNTTFFNVDPGVNATLELPQALTVSCDTWFYRLGYRFYLRQQQTGSLDMQRWANLLGL